MTRRERLSRAYRHEPLDRPCVCVRNGFPAADPSYDAVKAYLDAHAELKEWWLATVESPYPTETFKEPHSEEYERQVVLLHAPGGVLRRSWLLGLQHQPGMQETHYLKSREDAENYLSLPIPEMTGDVSGFAKQEARLGTRGHTEVHLGNNPAGQVASWFGSELFAIMTITDRELIHALCAYHQRILLDKVKYLARQGVGPFFTMEGQEYLVPPLHGKRDFDEFCLRYDKPIVDLIHEIGGRAHIHCHGRIADLLPSFVEVGCDVLHPFEGPPMSDLLPAQAKAAARGHFCLEGNIQIANMYEHTADQVRAETEALIRDCFDDGRDLIVCPSASPYFYGKGERCLPQIKAMVEAVGA